MNKISKAQQKQNKSYKFSIPFFHLFLYYTTPIYDLLFLYYLL